MPGRFAKIGVKRLVIWGGIIAAIALIAINLPKFGFGPGGGGPGTGPGGKGETPVNAITPPPTQPSTTGPIRVTVQGEQYLVDGKSVTLTQLVELAKNTKVANGQAAVAVVFTPTTRAKAQEDLRRALKAAGVTHSEAVLSESAPPSGE